MASRCQAANKKSLGKQAQALLGAREALGGLPLKEKYTAKKIDTRRQSA